MAWFWLLINTYFDFLVAAMVGVFLAMVAAKIVLQLCHLGVNFFLNRILIYGLALGFTLLFCTTYAASRTDPDFLSLQRYQHAFRAIVNWVFPADELLARDGMEKAITLDTEWVSKPETVFYTLGNQLYSVLTNGKDRRLRYTAEGEIVKAVFSPDGKWVLVKTDQEAVAYNLEKDGALSIYKISFEGVLSKDAKIKIGGIQWSPDNKKICFFVEKSSRVSTQSQWFIYDIKSKTETTVPLGAQQISFLMWAKDSQRLYFDQVVSRPKDRYGKAYRIKWFEIPLKTLTPHFVDEFLTENTYASKDELIQKGIHVFYPDKLLRFESAQPFFRKRRVVSPSGKSLWINKRWQLCYESAYRVRYCLLGVSSLRGYLNFPPKGRENELVIQDLRWLPSEKYVLLRHYTHGLLVLYPIKRRIGVLVNENVGIFGAYPG